ncbi:ribonuclease H-like domain-containing protein [Nemania sp. FL0031]|nr:ribonuclease H-like domain-containing protein [Nemania sp. FL0031]
MTFRGIRRNQGSSSGNRGSSSQGGGSGNRGSGHGSHGGASGSHSSSSGHHGSSSGHHGSSSGHHGSSSGHHGGGSGGRGESRDRGYSTPGGGDRGYSNAGGRDRSYSTSRGRGYSGSGGGSRGSSSGPRIYQSSSGAIPQPDARVTKVEDDLLGSPTSRMAGLSLGTSLPMRPGYGSKGTPLILWANYFALQAPARLLLYQHSLTVTPQAAGKKLSHIINLFLQTPQLRAVLQQAATDFKSTLIAREQIATQSFELFYRAEGEDEPLQDARRYIVKIELVKALSVGDLVSYLSSASMNTQPIETAPIIQGLNILVNHYTKSQPSDRIATIGSSKSFRLSGSTGWSLGYGSKAIRGYFTSVRAATGRILLNVQVNHSAFYEDKSLEWLMSEFNKQRLGLPQLEQFIRKLRVKVTHLPKKRNRSGGEIIRVKVISRLAHIDDGKAERDHPQVLTHPPRVKRNGAGAEEVHFWLDAAPGPSTSKGKGSASAGGRYISVYDYFKSAYNITIKTPGCPVVNVGTKQRPTYLPAEVCYVLPGQPMRRQLSSSQTSKMIERAVRFPGENAQSIKDEGLRTNGLPGGASPTQLEKFGATVSPTLITVRGRVLVEPKVIYADNKQTLAVAGNWNMVSRNATMKFCRSATLPKWKFVNFEMDQTYNVPKIGGSELGKIVDSYKKVLVSAGLIISNYAGAEIIRLNGNDDPTLNGYFQNLAGQGIKLLFVILPHSPIPVYNRIKQLGDVMHGIHTVCSVSAKIRKGGGMDQYLRNEALKVNLKLGGENHYVQPQGLGLISEDKTMVVGIDVTHPSPGSSDAAPSIAAMVASLNSKLGQWPGILKVQAKRRQEMVSALTEMLESRLELWRSRGRHSAFPENILVYRDGVSEGQYDEVLTNELPQLRAACRRKYPPADQARGLPRMTIVVVGKRHHTRFYVTKESDADRSGNSRAGTVVDRGVTQARNWDFFLQSHAAIKGTARPAHYFVLLDEIFRARYARDPMKNVADELQMVTQSMCYVFGRATKAVSYCTPAYYADILCERARCYLYHVFEDASSVPFASGATPEEIEWNLNRRYQDAIKIAGSLKDTMFYI